MAFQTTRELAQVHGVKCLVYGQPGVGKTLLCATAPAPLILSAENGLLTLRDYDIPVWPISSVMDLYNAYQWLTTNPEAKQFQTICLDSLSEIAETVLATELGKHKDGRKAYGEMAKIMRDYILYFRDLSGFHVYMTAKEGLLKDEASGVVRCGPSMPGTKLGISLPYFFDFVFQMDMGKDPKTGETFRFLKTEPEFNVIAKSRGGRLDAKEYPDLNAIFNKVLS